jgi:hypothetical protein
MEARRIALLACVAAVPLCELDVAGSICLNGGQQVVLPPAVPEGLVGHWTFESRPHDQSGHQNDAEGEVLPGPPRNGNGASGLFEQNFLLVPNAATLPAESFTYTFWLLRGHHAMRLSRSRGVRWSRRDPWVRELRQRSSSRR